MRRVCCMVIGVALLLGVGTPNLAGAQTVDAATKFVHVANG